jgi:hypothetical protein
MKVMKKLIGLFLILAFCVCIAVPAFAAEGDDSYTPSPSMPSACEHTSTKLVGQKDATCTEEGYTGDQVCDNCTEVLAQGEVIPALGHNFVEGICSNCGAEEEAPKNGSAWWWLLAIPVAGGAGFFAFRKKIFG